MSEDEGGMAKRMDWRRARKFSGSEMKFEDGKVLDSGVVIRKQRDGLAQRAREAERRWLKQKGLGSDLKRGK